MSSNVHNGMSAAMLTEASWRKSARSGALGNCVEVAALRDGEVAVRNARDPEGPVLVYTPAEISAFVDGAKKGEFDDMVERRTSD